MHKSNTKYWKCNPDFVIGAALWAEKDLYVSLKIASLKKAAGKTCCGRRHGDVGGHLVGALDKWSFGDGGNFCALRLVILHCIWDGVGDTFQLRFRWPWAVVCETLLAAVPWNEHDVAVWNIHVGKQSNRRRPDGVVGVYLRELCSNRDNFHHVAQLVNTKWSVFVPNGVFLCHAWFWTLEKRCARWV